MVTWINVLSALCRKTVDKLVVEILGVASFRSIRPQRFFSETVHYFFLKLYTWGSKSSAFLIIFSALAIFVKKNCPKLAIWPAGTGWLEFFRQKFVFLFLFQKWEEKKLFWAKKSSFYPSDPPHDLPLPTLPKKFFILLLICS